MIRCVFLRSTNVSVVSNIVVTEMIRDLHFSVSKFVSNFETVSNVKILVVNSLNIWDTVL